MKELKVPVVVALVFLSLSFSLAGASGDIMATLQTFVGVYNSQVVNQLPSYVQPLVANQQITGIVYLQDPMGNNPYSVSYNGHDISCYGSLVIGAVTDGSGRFVEFHDGEVVNPTIFISTSDSTINRIQNSATPMCDLLAAVSNGEIYLHGVGYWQKLQVLTINGLARTFRGSYC
jgi:hypothetical protein